MKTRLRAVSKRQPTGLRGFLLFSLACLLLPFTPFNFASTEGVAVLTIKGAIGPATTDYIRRGIENASESGDAAVVILIDTPGGLDAATRDINQAILASKIPVISFVYPEGARAASAGTYILYASHVAAMAPATNTGAATPVSIMAAPEDDESDKTQSDDDDGESEQPAGVNAQMRKAINDSVAYIRGLAEKRGRNADWAEKAVREAASLSANEALAEGVVDLIAGDLGDLLRQADGLQVAVSTGEKTLATAGVAIRHIDPDLRNRILARITDPSVAYLLFLIGIYGLLLEGYNPGVLVPGITGAICLTLALYAFQVLPINYAGALLIALGVGLLAAEAFAPSFGILGIGGIVALSFGSLVLIDEDITQMAISRGVIAGIGALSGLMFLGVSVLVARSRSRPRVTGTDLMIGQHAEVIDDQGRILLVGETWFTQSDQSLKCGDQVEVIGVDGLTLNVSKVDHEEKQS